jgi:hypothetical protein
MNNEYKIVMGGGKNIGDVQKKCFRDLDVYIKKNNYKKIKTDNCIGIIHIRTVLAQTGVKG